MYVYMISDTKERGAGNASIVITPTNYRSTGPVPVHRIFGYRWLLLLFGGLDREEHARCNHARCNVTMHIQDNLAATGTYSLLVRRGRKAYADDIYF